MAVARNLDSTYERQPLLEYQNVILEHELVTRIKNKQTTRKLLKQINETQS